MASKRGASNGAQVTMGEGEAPGRERWPFASLKKGKYFECVNLAQHTALRTAASRASRRYKRKFSVRKLVVEGQTVIRVYAQ